MSDWDTLGGELAVRGHVDAFVARVFADDIIGFLFEGRDRERVARHELEHASLHLGGPLAYTGRPLVPLHRALRLSRGHFRRRLAVLRTVLGGRGVPGDVVDRWVAHDASYLEVMTGEDDCVPKRTGSVREPG